MSTKLTAASIIEEEQFKMVKEYPAVVRVYENIAGDTIGEIFETTSGSLVQSGPSILLAKMPKNRDAVVERIEYLDWLESFGPDTLRSYRKNRKYSEYVKKKEADSQGISQKPVPQNVTPRRGGKA